VSGERVVQVVLGGIEGKISNKQFIFHVMSNCPDFCISKTVPASRA
jgi:hypothetical protein